MPNPKSKRDRTPNYSANSKFMTEVLDFVQRWWAVWGSNPRHPD